MEIEHKKAKVWQIQKKEKTFLKKLNQLVKISEKTVNNEQKSEKTYA